MKANVYLGPYKLAIKDKPKPKVQQPTDVILKITATCICGSDLHLYHGLISPDLPGQTLGHENVGVVDEVGSAVKPSTSGFRSPTRCVSRSRTTSETTRRCSSPTSFPPDTSDATSPA